MGPNLCFREPVGASAGVLKVRGCGGLGLRENTSSLLEPGGRQIYAGGASHRLTVQLNLSPAGDTSGAYS